MGDSGIESKAIFDGARTASDATDNCISRVHKSTKNRT